MLFSNIQCTSLDILYSKIPGGDVLFGIRGLDAEINKTKIITFIPNLAPRVSQLQGAIYNTFARYINNSRHLARKYARIFVREHYLYREMNSFPRAKTLSYEEQIMSKNKYPGDHIFAPNGGYCLYYPSNLLRNARSFQNWGIFNNYSPKWRRIVLG